MTCIGNSGPLPEPVAEAIEKVRHATERGPQLDERPLDCLTEAWDINFVVVVVVVVRATW